MTASALRAVLWTLAVFALGVWAQARGLPGALLAYWPDVARKAVLDQNPKLADLLNAISAKLDDATMARLNASVDVDKKSVEDVAENFLMQAGLV